jgi:hypothetical protein
MWVWVDACPTARRQLRFELLIERNQVAQPPKPPQNATRQVERYHFFGSSIRSWQPTARGLLEERTDESETDGMLATCLRVLREVHSEFFADKGGGGGKSGEGGGSEAAGGDGGNGVDATSSAATGAVAGGLKKAPTKRRRLKEPDGSGQSGSEGLAHSSSAATASNSAPTLAPAPLDPAALKSRDVRTCLADARAHVLRGCTVCFSRCWPQFLTPFEQPLWVLAEGLGASCSTQYTAGRTTHVVAAPDRGGDLPLTDKVRFRLVV